jgi:hypothetical protein
MIKHCNTIQAKNPSEQLSKMELVDRCIDDACTDLLASISQAYKGGEKSSDGLLLVCDRKLAEAYASLQDAFVQHGLAQSLQEMFLVRMQVISFHSSQSHVHARSSARSRADEAACR